jgi:hypothetical protein
MALSELECKRIERAVGRFMEKRRPPPHIRPKLDLGFRITGQSVEIFSVRPRWNKPDERSEQSIAKATFVRTSGTWRVFWQRADLKWHRYEPAPEVSDIESFLEQVDKDECSCFFG